MEAIITAILLGIVEGLTEFIPVSSTGHLILASELLGYSAETWATFNVIIQLGAILAVIVLYWRTFLDVMTGLMRSDAASWRFARNILIAFFPAIVIALLIGDFIDMMLESAVVVAWALIIGGIAILVVEKLAKPVECGGVANVGFRQAVGIGIVQCLAMIPGVSRSGATILGAMSLGVDRKTAAEFSFFLAVPTLSGATVMQLFRHGETLTEDMIGWIALGSFISFVVAIVVVKAFITIVTRYGFAPFAWYRIIAGTAALVWLTVR